MTLSSPATFPPASFLEHARRCLPVLGRSRAMRETLALLETSVYLTIIAIGF